MADAHLQYLCVVEYFFEEAPGGSGRVARDEARAMRDRGYAVTLFFYAQGNDRPPVSEFEGIRLVRFHKEPKPAWHPGRLNAIVNSAARACRRLLGDRQWDIVHIHTPLIGLGVLDALGPGPRYVSTVHSPIVAEQEIIWRNQGLVGALKLLFGRGALRRAERKLLLGVSAIHTLSDYTRTVLESSYQVGNRATIIPHWYEQSGSRKDKSAARQALGWPVDRTIVLTVRGLGPRYGVDIAVRAIAPLVVAQKCMFYIGGRGPMREMLEQLAADMGATGGIRFLGRLSNEELELAYSAADLFVLPTIALECFGLITIEALSFGCPVISSDAAAIPEIMRPVLPDCIVPAGDADALHDKVEQFLDGRLVLPDADTLVKHVQENYDREMIIDRYIRLFEARA
jgi:glycosyltransferase involved in cell wall biosynthesis